MRFSESNFSEHALVRLIERFRIAPQELIEILNAGHGKKIGVSAKTHLMHRLVWSPTDESLLVAIQDVVNGTILTVLTLDMYCRDYERNITDRRVKSVVNKMVHAGLAPADLWTPGAADEYVLVYLSLSGTDTFIPLGNWKGQVSSPNLEHLGGMPEFWKWLANQVEEKGHPIERVEKVAAKFNGGDLQHVPFGC